MIKTSEQQIQNAQLKCYSAIAIVENAILELNRLNALEEATCVTIIQDLNEIQLQVFQAAL